MEKILYLNNFECPFIDAVKDVPTTGTPATELNYGILRLNNTASGVLVNPTGGDYYLLTAFKRSGGAESAFEVIKVTEVDITTYPGECRIKVDRAQEGTSAKAYVTGDLVQLRWTKGSAEAAQQAGDKDASGGIPGLTLFKLNLRNALNTVTSWFTTAATAARTWTMPDKDGTVAMTSDLGGFRDKLINPTFAINQRGVSGTVTLAAGAYGHDGWKAGSSGCTYTFATTANVTTLTISAGSLQQVVDGRNLDGGTHVLSWSGTSAGKIGAGSYSASGATGSVTGGANITIEFSTGTLARPRFELGSIPNPFEPRHVSIEEMLCLGYFQNVYASQFEGQSWTVTTIAFNAKLPVKLRGAASVITLIKTHFEADPYDGVLVNGVERGAITASLTSSTAKASYLRGTINGFSGLPTGGVATFTGDSLIATISSEL